MKNNLRTYILLVLAILFIAQISRGQSYKEIHVQNLIINTNAQTDGSHSLTLSSSTIMTGSLTFTLPPTSGSAGEVLSTLGNGTLTFTTPSSGGGSVAGTLDGEAQVKDGSGFAASSSFIWDEANNHSGIGTSSPSYSVDAYGAERTGGERTNGFLIFASSESGTYSELIWNFSSSINTIYNWPSDDGTDSQQGLFTNGSSSFNWQGDISSGPTGAGDLDNNDIWNGPDNAYIGGGDNNDINSGGADNSVIYGGDNNDINNSMVSSGIVGGDDNDLNGSGSYSVILGGDDNDINGGATSAAVVGGDDNDINGSASYSVILGGDDNDINNGAVSSAIVGGQNNDISGSASYSFIGAGDNNDINSGSVGSAVFGGDNNEMNGSESDFSMIGSGRDHDIFGLESAVMSGRNNDIGANGDRVAIFGGLNNEANQYEAFVGGGQTNEIWSGSFTTIFGGLENTVNSSDYSAVAGGFRNDFNSTSHYSSILGGRNHDFNNSDYGAVLWGDNNDFNGNDNYSLAGGTACDVGNDYQIVIGRQPQAWNFGMCYLSDGNASYFNELWTDNTFGARFTGGFYFSTHSSGTIHVSVEQANGDWVFPSDSSMKEKILKLSPIKVLAKLLTLKISSWNYKSAGRDKRNYGPMAQDFYNLFGRDKYGTFSDDKTIKSHDVSSVFVAGVQGAGVKQREGAKRLNKIKSNQSNIKTSLEELEVRMKLFSKKIE